MSLNQGSLDKAIQELKVQQLLFEFASNQVMFKQRAGSYVDVRNKADSALMGIRASVIHAFTNLTLENAGAGANPVLSSNHASNKLNINGHVKIDLDIQFLSATAYYASLVHAITAHRTYTFPDKDLTIADDADITTLKAFNAIGSANKQYEACIPYSGIPLSQIIFETTGMTMENVGNTDSFLAFLVPLSTNKGGLKLYVDDLLMQVLDADAGDIVEAWWLVGLHAGRTDLITDTTDTITPEERTNTGNAIDCSTYDYVIILIDFTVTNAGDLNFELPRVGYYFDT